MGTAHEREVRGVEIDVMEFIERNGREIERRKEDAEAYAKALSFESFKIAWRERRFSNVHLGKPAQQTYNSYVQCAYDCAMKYARCGKTLAERVLGAYSTYALRETQLEGENVLVYASPEAIEALTDLSDECLEIGVHGVGLALAKMVREEAFVIGTRDVTNVPASRMGSGTPEVFREFDETVAMHEALGHLLQGDMDEELETMRASAGAYTSALATATRLDQTSSAAPMTICSTVDTLFKKTRTKVENALKPPIDAAGETLMLPGAASNPPMANLDSMPSFG
jgi:hypothetical protein